MGHCLRHALLRPLLFSVLAHGILLIGVSSICSLPQRQGTAGLRVVMRPASVDFRQPAPRFVAAPALPAQPRAAPSKSLRAVAAAPQALSPVAAGADRGEAAEGLAAADVRQYRVALAMAARHFKPAQATPGGRVELAVTMQQHSTVPLVVLHRSSGTTLLDDAAMDMMKRAAAFAELPGGMKARDFRIILSLLFSFDEESPP